MTDILAQTESVCPKCLARIPAQRVLDGENVYLEKQCDVHGSFRTIIWRGRPSLSDWQRTKIPAFPQYPLHVAERGCPYDCGLCPHHRQQTCCVLLEVTQRCDLNCPLCFADSGKTDAQDLSLDAIAAWYQRLLDVGGPYNIQLSGGEPSLRNDLPEIIRMGRALGFNYFQLNSNGLRPARDFDYLKRLKAAGLNSIFLQFDGTHDEIYRKIRGRAILQEKMRLIENCERLNVGVILVPVLIPGVNFDDIGNIIRLALEHMPIVRGVHFQPVSYFGRYPQAPCDESRITIPEVMRAIEVQTQGLISTSQFSPPTAEHATCSFHANFVQMKDGSLKSVRNEPEPGSCCQPIDALAAIKCSRQFVAQYWSAADRSAQVQLVADDGFAAWDEFIERRRTHTFCLSAMSFQDAWTLDMERLRQCKVHIASPNGMLVPFCAYNLTNQLGEAIYRGQVG